jgi:uncharacterized protein YjiS (DUF1127 family)
MQTVGTASEQRFKRSAHLSHLMLSPSEQRRQIHRLMLALHSLDDRVLAQLGLERTEIERFAQAAVAHGL